MLATLALLAVAEVAVYGRSVAGRALDGRWIHPAEEPKGRGRARLRVSA